MRLFLDTNVILDLLGRRDPFFDAIAKIATLADSGQLELVASPLSITTVHYVLSRVEPRENVMEKLRKFHIICEICVVDGKVMEKALNAGFPDFEDAVQYFSAVSAGCHMIITRNGKDFKKSELPFMTADAFLSSRR